MKRLFGFVVVLALAVGPVACKKPKADKPADTPTTTKPADKPADKPVAKPADKPAAGGDDALFEEAMKLNEKIAAAVDANKADCDKMGKAIAELATANKDLIAKANAMKAKMTPDQMKAMALKQAERSKTYAAKLVPMGACMAKSKELQDAMKMMAGAPKTAAPAPAPAPAPKKE